MNIEKFEKIDITNDKILSIVNSAFKIFANNNFEKASTNLIVADARISRGILYHYFTNKKELFDFLIYFSAKKILFNMVEHIDWSDSDYLNRLRQSLISKTKTILEFPYLYSFCKKYIALYTKAISETFLPGITERFYHENLRFDQVRDDIDVEMMKQTISLALSELVRKIFDRIVSEAPQRDKEQTLAQATAEIDQYLKFFRQVFYQANKR